MYPEWISRSLGMIKSDRAKVFVSRPIHLVTRRIRLYKNQAGFFERISLK